MVPEGFKRMKEEAKGLWILAQMSHEIISITFYWPQKVTRPAKIQGPTLDETICRELVTNAY